MRIPPLVLVVCLFTGSLAVEPSLPPLPAPVVSANLLGPPSADVLDETMQPPAAAAAPPALSDEALRASNLDLPEWSLPHPQPEPLRPDPVETESDDPYSELAVATDAQVLRADEAGSTPGPDEQWIDVNLSEQRITAYVGATALRTTAVSSGVARHPTVVGRFYVYLKLYAQRMKGGSRETYDDYDLPDVPDVMYFFEDYAIHGAYWHHNFGHPMSHGCVNLPLDDAHWFFEWAPIGTLVLVHD